MIVADQYACATMFAEGDGAFDVPAEGEAGCAQHTAFFLQAAAVGEHDAGSIFRGSI